MANPQTDTRVYPADFLPQLQQALGTLANLQIRYLFSRNRRRGRRSSLSLDDVRMMQRCVLLGVDHTSPVKGKEKVLRLVMGDFSV